MTDDPLVGTENFAPDEWERVSTGGYTPMEFRANAQATLEVLQLIRGALGVPVLITSAWRSFADNSRIGGEFASQHLTADAADFVVPSLSKRTVAARLDHADAYGQLGGYRQLIYYLTDEHFHIGTGVGKQRLVKVDSTRYAPYLGADTLPDSTPVSSPSSGVLLLLVVALGVGLVIVAVLMRKP